jgi:hypothetical protein
MRSAIFCALVLFSFAFSSVGCGLSDLQKEYSRLHSDSGIQGRPYDEIVAEMRELAQKHSSIASFYNYGSTPGRRELSLIRIAREGDFSARKGVLITGTIHGDEFLNIEDRLPRWFLENQASEGVEKFLSRGGILWIVPILNPDGYMARRRESIRGMDLNRDFDLLQANKAGFTQPETRGLTELLQTELSKMRANLALTMDYHCCVGGVIYPWGFSRTKVLPQPERDRHLKFGSIMLEQFPRYIIGRAIEIVNYTALGASDDYYHEKFKSASFTFEGVRFSEKNNFPAHTVMWNNLLRKIADESMVPMDDLSTEKPRLAIVSSQEGGQVMLAISASTRAAAVYLCQGDTESCHQGNSIIPFHRNYQAGNRLIFRAQKAIGIAPNQVMTIQSSDDFQRKIGISKVRFTRGKPIDSY